MNIYTVEKQKEDTIKELDLISLLDKESKSNQKEGWNKLNKTKKLILLNQYADRYGSSNKLQKEEILKLKDFLKHNLITTKLLKVKDVVYNKEDCKIEKISSLLHDKNRFTLKRAKQQNKNKTVKK